MRLISPHVSYQQSYNDYIDELGDEERYPYPMDLPHHDFHGLVAQLNGFAEGKALFANMVPNSTFWLVDNNEIVAVSHLRHYLNDDLLKMGGHIGLGVRPNKRAKGLGKQLLALTLEKAHAMGISKIHIHCYKQNLASARMIEACGAMLDSEISDESGNSVVSRYLWSKC